jgi:hypothetical protein
MRANAPLVVKMSVFCVNLCGLDLTMQLSRFNSVVASQTHLYKFTFCAIHMSVMRARNMTTPVAILSAPDTTAQRRNILAAIDCWLATRAAKNLSP